MCGIIAYTGSNNCIPILLHGLSALEYRGYDSAGISIVQDGLIKTSKCLGEVNGLLPMVLDCESVCGIGHTRWATHGQPSVINAHPHVTSDKRLSIVHNGIIENYLDLKKELEQKYSFVSDTDSEVLLYQIYDFMQKGEGILNSVKIALKKVVGAYAIVVMGENGQMIIAKKGSPLVVGLGVNEIMVGSDSGAFGDRATLGIVYLKDSSIGEITDKLNVYDLHEEIEINYEIERVYDKSLAIDKGNYDSFMLKEIFEQPKTVSDCLRGRLDEYSIKLGGLIGYEHIFKKANHITIVSCGSSWHASLLAKYYIEEFCRIKVCIESAGEFRYRKPVINKGDIVVGVSQSGETADTLGALEIAKICGAITVGICNVVGSSMSKLTDCGIHLRSGVEVGVASTKTFTNQVICLLLLALWIEQIKEVLGIDHRQVVIDDLRKLPEYIEESLRSCENIQSVAREFSTMSSCLFLGRGYNFPIALEGALKLKEISYIHAEGYPAAEMKHGPIALIDKNMPVIMIANNYNNHSKIINNMKEIQARDGKIIAIYANSGDVGDYIIRVPNICDVLSPLLSIVPLQLFAYYSAVLRNKNVDKPRNLAKSVTVE